MRPVSIAAVITCAVCLGACDNHDSSTAPTPRAVTVVVARSKALVQGGAITGEIRARVQTDLSFRTSGKIIERLVEVGETVKAGQLLARIDPEEQEAELDVAVANLQTADALEMQAQQTFERQRSLYKTQVSTRATFDDAEEALLTAQATKKSAQAQLDTARDSLSFTELRADADGVITGRSAEIGQVAQAAQVVFTLAHDGERDAVFDVVESVFLRGELDPHISINLLSDPAQTLDAKVREVSPTIDSKTGTAKVKVALSSDRIIPLGEPVVGSFRYRPRQVIQLPWSAIASRNGKPVVWIVDPQSSKVSVRPIEVSCYETGSLVVKEGLSAGDMVVTQGTRFLAPGETVSYQEEGAK